MYTIDHVVNYLNESMTPRPLRKRNRFRIESKSVQVPGQPI